MFCKLTTVSIFSPTILYYLNRQHTFNINIVEVIGTNNSQKLTFIMLVLIFSLRGHSFKTSMYQLKFNFIQIIYRNLKWVS